MSERSTPIPSLLQIGDRMVNLERLDTVEWEPRGQLRLYVGGRLIELVGDEARRTWELLCRIRPFDAACPGPEAWEEPAAGPR
jgi:hypothetical protein